MNRKGEVGDNQISQYLVYFILLVIFIVPVVGFANSQRDGAAIWEDFYVKEIARMINLAEPGVEVDLDVSAAVRVGFERGVKDVNSMFSFDNVDNRVIVSLRQREGTSYGFFNDVDVVDWRVEVIPEEEPVYRLHFSIVEVQK